MLVSIRLCDADANADANVKTIANANSTSTNGRQSVAASRTLAFTALVLCLGCGISTIPLAESFQTTTTPLTQPPVTTHAHSKPLHLFGRNKDGDSSKIQSKTTIKESENGDIEKKRPKIPFFRRLKRSKEGDNKEQQPSVAAAATSAATSTAPKSKKRKDPPTPDDLRLMAEKARLEADRLDAELTLSKIEKLEQKLVKSKKDGDSTANSNSRPESDSNPTVVVEDLQEQLDALQAKLRGEPVKVKVYGETTKPAVATTTTTSASSTSEESSSSVAKKDVLGMKNTKKPRTGPIAEVDDASVLKAAAIIAESEPDFFSQVRTEKELDILPGFLINVIAPFYGMKNSNVDRQELLKRGNMAKELDYSFFDIDPPAYDQLDIQEKRLQIVECDKTNLKDGVSELKAIPSGGDLSALDNAVVVTKKMLEKADGNATQLAIYSLDYDYYMFSGIEKVIDQGADIVISELFQNSSYFGSMYPKCVTKAEEIKDDDYVSEEPTEAQMDTLTKTILPAIKFSSSSKPTKVPGGYAITGSHKFEDGDKLIEAIDNEIAKSRPNLKDQMTVLYTPSYGPLNQDLGQGTMDINSLMSDPDVLELFAESEPILYVTGPTIVRDANRLGLTITSILGLATAWYLSVYPFLLNDQIAGRIDADLQLVEANLQPDLSYLTDLSIPLFVSFMGIQLVHEAAHRLVAMSKGVKLSVPVFVPSLITGITSTVTTFKTLPKNKNDMFDISAAGPLAGVAVSSIALVIGAKLTLISDPATLPALPLDILRQSTLGGAIIDNIIQGSLYVPEGAPTAGITIPLHAIGIAGYVGLIVNALALLPIGSTDGGRLTMALFDRAEKMSIGSLTLTALFFAGFFGSDLFLFYFSFCLAFQTGNEIPARNEHDSVDFSRVLVALVCYALAILTLVPFQ